MDYNAPPNPLASDSADGAVPSSDAISIRAAASATMTMASEMMMTSDWASLAQEISLLVFTRLANPYKAPVRLVCKSWSVWAARSSRHICVEGRGEDAWGERFCGLRDLTWAVPRGLEDSGLSHLSINLERITFKCIDDHTLTLAVDAMENSTALTSVSLEDCEDVTQVGLGELSRLPSLASLGLRQMFVTDAALTPVLGLRELRSLSLFGCHMITDDVIKILHQSLPALTSLNLAGLHQVSDAGLAELVKIPDLSFLDLSMCFGITDTGLAHMRMLPRLQSLKLVRTQVTDQGMSELGIVSTLTLLNLCGCYKITDAGMSHLRRLPALASLDLTQCGHITDSGLKEISNLPSLKELVLCGCFKVSQLGLSELARRVSNLSSLNLNDCVQVTDECLASAIRHLSKLEVLSLGNCTEVTDKGLAHVRHLTALQELLLYNCNKVSSSGVESLGRLTALCSLDLDRCDQITDPGFAELGNALKGLTKLNLASCSITDEGLVGLGRMPGLTELNLSNCSSVTDQGLIDSLRGFPSLSSLRLGFLRSRRLPEDVKERLKEVCPALLNIR